MARDLLDEAVEALGVAIGSSVTLLDVERVVIGGGIGERLGPKWLTRIERAAARHVLLADAGVRARRARRPRRRDRREPADALTRPSVAPGVEREGDRDRLVRPEVLARGRTPAGILEELVDPRRNPRMALDLVRLGRPADPPERSAPLRGASRR